MFTTLATLPLILPLLVEEPFAELGFDAALEKAKSEQKLLLLDFTASWCGPCRKMEKDTWADADVRAWLRENAIAIQVDVDEQKDLAARFTITAMPTVVAMREGAEFDRIVGYRDAAAFLGWGRGVNAGRRASDGLLDRSKTLRESEDVQARYDLAGELVRAGLHDEALRHYLWLWPATREVPRLGGVRVSFMLSTMAQLARVHEAAKEAFHEIFAELQSRVDAVPVPAFQDWMEWAAFCNYFDGRARVVAWYEKHRDEDGRLLDDIPGPQREKIVSDVFDALSEEARWLDAVRLYDDCRPRAESILARYRETLPVLEQVDQEGREQLGAIMRNGLIDDLGTLHGALLLAQRSAEAAEVSRILFAALDTPDARIGLVRHGTAIYGRADPSFARWLDEAEAAGGDVASLRQELVRLESQGGR